MKRIIALVLTAVLAFSLFSGCKENGDSTTQKEEETPMMLETPVAMASFGNSPITGVETVEPADLTVLGTSEIKNISVLVGDNDGSYTARTLKGYDSEMTFSIEGVIPNAPAMIDIEEIHLRDDGAIAYCVYINGVEVFGRTYAPIADGPNHAFFDVPADVVGDSGKLTIRLVNRSDNEVRFRQVWAISNPEVVAQEQGISQKMDVVLMLNEQPNNLNYEYLKKLVESYRCNDMYNVGLCWEIQYLQWGKATTEQWLNNVINASIQTGAPLYLGINSWWGGTPSAMDGQGGWWQDAQYQQITYDKNNSDGRGHWQQSAPNEWSDTPWLSMNNDYYNGVRVQRIRETVEFLQKRTAEIALAGKNIPAIHLYTENEPYYWPINWSKHEFFDNPNGVGDFSKWVIQDAAADGITLDPSDGLSEEEAFWLYRNLNTYISEVGQAMADGLGYNYITVKDGVVTYPTTQMVSDAYSHTPIHPIYPNWEDNRRAWENHILDSIHFGGEWSVWQNDDAARSLDYLIAYGSFANINAERAGFPGGLSSTDFRVLSQCYAYGLEGVIIYNVLKDSDQQNVISESLVADTPMNIRYYENDPIYLSDFTKKTAYSLNNTLVGIKGLRWDNTAVIPNVAEGGMLTYKLTNAADYASGIRVVTSGTFADPNGCIEILVGTSLENMKSAGIFHAANLNENIDPALYTGGSEIYIQVKIGGEGLTTAQMAGLALSRVGIYRTGCTNGRTDGTVYTYRQNRIRCQLIAARADAERMLNRYIEKAGGSLTTDSQKTAFATAYNLYAQGKYGEAFASISQAISQLLPATFVVSGYGQLGEYPVQIAVNGDAKVTVELKEVSDSVVRFTLSASSKADVTVSLLTDSGSWSMKQDAEDWVITAGDTAPTDGKVSFTASLSAYQSKEYPLEFEAMVLHSSASSLVVVSQDTRVTDYCYSAEFPVSTDVKVYRGPDGVAKEDLPESNIANISICDYVQVKRNDRGAIVEIYAWYGIITGTVIAVEEMSLFGDTVTNPFVTIQAADGTIKRLEIGYNSTLSFTGATGRLGKLTLVDSVGLTVGQQVTATYCPYTVNGRTRIIEISD